MKRKASALESTTSSSSSSSTTTTKASIQISLEKILEYAEDIYINNPNESDDVRLQYVFTTDEKEGEGEEAEPDIVWILDNNPQPISIELLNNLKELEEIELSKMNTINDKESNEIDKFNDILSPEYNINIENNMNIDNNINDNEINDIKNINSNDNKIVIDKVNDDDKYITNITTNNKSSQDYSAISQFHPLPNQPPLIPTINYSNSYESQINDVDEDNDNIEIETNIIVPKESMNIDTSYLNSSINEITEDNDSFIYSGSYSQKDLNNDNNNMNYNTTNNNNNNNNQIEVKDQFQEKSKTKNVTFKDNDEIEEWMIEAMVAGTDEDDELNNNNNNSFIKDTDPLLFSRWPEFVLKRLNLYKPLPMVEDILNASNNNNNSFIVYWVQNTFRIKDNLPLNLAMFLSKELKIPLLVISIIDHDSYQDILHGNKQLNSRTTAYHSFCRKSFGKMVALEDFKKSLEKMNIPLLTLTVQNPDNTPIQNSSYCEEAGLVCSAILRLCSILPIFSLLTDEIYHPSGQQIASKIVEMFPKLVFLSFDSSSIVLKEHIMANANIVNDDREIYSCKQNFHNLCKEVIKQFPIENWNFASYILDKDVQQKLYIEEKGSMELFALQIIKNTTGNINIAPVEWYKIISSLDNYFNKQNITMMDTYPLCKRWTETSINQYMDEILDYFDKSKGYSTYDSWRWEGMGYGIAIIYNALMRDIISPMEIIKRVKNNQYLWSKVITILISNEFAKFRCSQYKVPSTDININIPVNKIQWFRLIPSAVIQSLEYFHKTSSHFSNDPKVSFPNDIRHGQTKNKLFNKIQITLVYGGVIPKGYLAQYWILYLMSTSVSAQLGLKIALKELATHSTILVADSSILVPIFMIDVIDTCTYLNELSVSTEKHLIFEQALLNIEKNLRLHVGDIEFDGYKNTFVLKNN